MRIWQHLLICNKKRRICKITGVKSTMTGIGPANRSSRYPGQWEKIGMVAYMQKPIDNRQSELQNDNEEIEGDGSVDELTVLPGPSNIENRKDITAIVGTPEGRVEQSDYPTPAVAPSKRMRDNPTAKAVSLLESIAKRGSTVMKRRANDAMTRAKQRIARNQIQAVISELEDDESGTN